MINFSIASVRQRFYGNLIDGIILLPVQALNSSLEVFNPGLLRSIAFLLVVLIPVLYDVILHFLSGQTVGKKFQKIVVLDYKSGVKLSLKQSILRSSVSIFLNLLLIVSLFQYLVPGVKFPGFYLDFAVFVLRVITPLIYLWLFSEVVSMFFNSERRSIHDLIAGTIVVQKQNA
jgi:uncharacterized RDD family membrane protein YckC